MSNILYIGNFKSPSGWGSSARDIIRALNKTSHNLSIKNIYLDNNQDTSFELSHLENNKLDSLDIVIQNLLPNFIEYIGGVKNVCLFYSETKGFQTTDWPNRLNCLTDEIWVCSEQEKENLKQTGVTTPIEVIPMPIDTSFIDGIAQEKDNGSFKFYFIGEYIDRKNLRALLIAFHREFSPSENVELIIKTSLGGYSSAQLRQLVFKDIYELKQTMRLYSNIESYKGEMVITDSLSYEDIIRLHKQCDCLVMPSRGESCSRPVLEAQYCGNTTIVTDGTGMVNGWGNQFHVESEEVPCITSQPPLSFYHTAKEVWREINIIWLQFYMRTAYKLWNNNNVPSINASKNIKENYSIEALTERLEQLC